MASFCARLFAGADCCLCNALPGGWLALQLGVLSLSATAGAIRIPLPDSGAVIWLGDLAAVG